MMKNNILHIKNMVCDRCLMSVQNTLSQQNLTYKELSLGRIEFENELTQKQIRRLEIELKAHGFEIVAERINKIVNRIKSVIIEMVYKRKDFKNKKLSEILGQELHYDYSHLTGIFSKSEGQSIQSYQNRIRAERIKELLEYDEFNISQIADIMDFGSAAYLSTFFKKETGISPSRYKTEISARKPLDKL